MACSIAKKLRIIFCFTKIRKKARVVGLLKPGKDLESPKSYRPISLLCNLYKLYERMTLSCMIHIVEENLTPDQAGFRAGKSCCSQVLNLTQFTENGCEKKQITGADFVDLTAAYDIVNLRSLLLKVASMIRNTTLIRIIESLLNNRQFFVEMDGRKSRWRKQKKKRSPAGISTGANAVQYLYKRSARFSRHP